MHDNDIVVSSRPDLKVIKVIDKFGIEPELFR